MNLGIDLDALDENNNTALIHAVRSLDLGAVKILVEAGASVNVDNGSTMN